MTKKKSSVLTVAEFALNWLEATNHSPTHNELGPESAQPAPNSPGAPTITEGWSEGRQRAIDGTEGEVDLVDHSGVETEAGNWALVGSWTAIGPKGTSHSWEADPTGERVVEVAEPSYLEVATNLVPLPLAELEYSEEEVRQAFWELLKTVRYDVWGT